VAAPIFRAVARPRCAGWACRPPRPTRTACWPGERAGRADADQPAGDRAEPILAVAQALAIAPGTLPDVRGLSAREATRVLHRAGVEPRLSAAAWSSASGRRPAPSSAPASPATWSSSAASHNPIPSAGSSMTLGQLLERTSVARRPRSRRAARRRRSRAPVAGVEFDSRRVVAGSVFVGMKGEKADGAAFAQQALVKGACAVVAEAPAPAGWTLPWARVGDDHAALAALAAVFYGHPSDDLLVVGITGTNGKTTTSYLTAGIFDEGGVRCGRLGTVSYDVGGTEREAPRTTPEATDFQRCCARWRPTAAAPAPPRCRRTRWC
jgi:hypothetical protein